MVKVKICGITRLEDALAAVRFGADGLGFVFYERSPRFISPEKAGEIVRHLPPMVAAVGVFVNESRSRIDETIKKAGLDVVQLHGDETPEMCGLWPRVIKAFRVRDLTDLDLLNEYKVSAYLLDTYDRNSPGGTGRTFNWDIAAEAVKLGRVILAGGLTPDNIAKAVELVRPYAVDVSTGVEKEKGVKDPDKIRRFIEKAKSSPYLSGGTIPAPLRP